MEIPFAEIVESIDVPAVIVMLALGGFKVIRRLDSLIAGVDGIKREQSRVADELEQHKRQDREDFRLVHERLDREVLRR